MFPEYTCRTLKRLLCPGATFLSQRRLYNDKRKALVSAALQMKAVKKMPEHPHVYPFKRVTETAIAKPRAGGKRRARVAAAENVAKCSLLAVVFFLMARAQILGGLHPFGPACFAAAAVVWPRRGTLFAIPVFEK